MDIQIGKTLKELMHEKRFNLTQLSKAAGVPTSTLNEWLTNRTPRNPIQVKKVALTLKVSLHYLLFAEEEPEAVFKIKRGEQALGSFEIVIRRSDEGGRNG